MTNVGFGSLTFAVQPVVENTGTDSAPVWTLNTTGIVASTTVVAGILDPAGGINRTYNPYTVGFSPVAGTDTAATWLPTVSAAGLTATQITDNYWTPATGNAGGNKIGQVSLSLVPAAKDTVRASSVMSFKLSPNALVITATGTFA